MATCSDYDYDYYSGTDSCNAWTSWNSGVETTTDSCSSAWHCWINNDTTNTPITSSVIWEAWCNDGTRYEVVACSEPVIWSKKRASRTIKFRNRLEKRRDKRRRKDLFKIELHKRKREAAEVKAKELLLDLIGDDQLEVYERTGRLFVRGKKNDYIVQKKGYVKKVGKDKVVDLCIHLSNKTKYPETDNVVALKLLIEGNEKEFIKTAHKVYNNPMYNEMPECACLQ